MADEQQPKAQCPWCSDWVAFADYDEHWCTCGRLADKPRPIGKHGYDPSWMKVQ